MTTLTGFYTLRLSKASGTTLRSILYAPLILALISRPFDAR